MTSKDPARKYCTDVEGKKGALQCSFCGTIFLGGGITRFKYHLSGTDPERNVKTCASAPPEVRDEMRKALKEKEIVKKKKEKIQAQIRAELRGKLGTNE